MPWPPQVIAAPGRMCGAAPAVCPVASCAQCHQPVPTAPCCTHCAAPHHIHCTAPTAQHPLHSTTPPRQEPGSLWGSSLCCLPAPPRPHPWVLRDVDGVEHGVVLHSQPQVCDGTALVPLHQDVLGFQVSVCDRWLACSQQRAAVCSGDRSTNFSIMSK